MATFLKKIVSSYIFIAVSALLLGVFFADSFVALAPYVTWYLGGIFFLSSLTIDVEDVVSYFEDKVMLLAVVFAMLILFPVGVYFLASFLYPPIAVAFLLLAAMPSGMTAPLLSEVSGGKQGLALVLTVLTSLVAPITVPLVVSLFVGADVAVGFLDMATSLATIIFIPFILAQVTKRSVSSLVESTQEFFKPASLLLLGLLIAGVVAKQVSAITVVDYGQIAIYLAALVILFVLLHLVGYFLVFWRSHKDRVTISVCLTYMNFTLAIYLADTFFSDPQIVLVTILAVVPWALMLPAFRTVLSRWQKYE